MSVFDILGIVGCVGNGVGLVGMACAYSSMGKTETKVDELIKAASDSSK